MKKSVVIIGKGPSVRRSTKKWIDSFDEVIICNRPVFKGYEHLISNRATYQFRNNSTQDFSAEEIHDLGLKGVFSTAALDQKLSCHGVPTWCDVPIYYAKEYFPTLVQKSASCLSFVYNDKSEVSASTGIIAFAWAVNSNRYNKITLVGFDMMEVHKDCYYFKPDEYQGNLKYLLGTAYTSEGKIKSASAHSSEDAKKYIAYEMAKHTEISFMTCSDNQDFIKKITGLINTSILEKS